MITIGVLAAVIAVTELLFEVADHPRRKHDPTFQTQSSSLQPTGRGTSVLGDQH